MYLKDKDNQNKEKNEVEFFIRRVKKNLYLIIIIIIRRIV
jgi:hypothetical protein